MASSSRRRRAPALLLVAGLLALPSAGCQAPPPPATSNPTAPPSGLVDAAASTPAPSSAPPTASGRENAVVIGERQTFHSTSLDEDRTVLVHIPASYKQGKDVYPVLYLLDGEENFHHTTGITTFLSDAHRAPEMIVVGVTSTPDGRERDMTPTALADRPATGGAARFLSFLKDELRPRIEGAYRTAPYRILVGHSFGGLFALHALTSAPDAFDAYVVMSPSLWWDDARLLHGAEKSFASHPELQAFLYLTTGNEGGQMLADTTAFAATLKAKGPPGLTWEFKHLDRESHASLPHRSTYDGLEKLFTGWEAPPDITTLKALVAHYEALSKKFHFEVKLSEKLLNTFAFAVYEKHRDEAMAAFKLSVQLHPESAGAYDTLGEAYGDRGEIELAKESFETAVRKGTETSDPYLPEMKAHLERVSKAKAR